MVGYDEQNTILLPPRVPGSQLPKQLLDHYNRTNTNQQDENTVLPTTAEEETTGEANQQQPQQQGSLAEMSSGSVPPVQDGVSMESNLVEMKSSNVDTDKGTLLTHSVVKNRLISWVFKLIYN